MFVDFYNKIQNYDKYSFLKELFLNETEKKIEKKQNLPTVNRKREIEKVKISEIQIETPIEHTFYHSWSQILGYFNDQKIFEHKELQKTIEPENQNDFFQNYICFCKIINLEDIGYPVNKFEFKYLKKIFSSNYIDQIIHKFIEKVIRYELECSKDLKQKYVCLYQLILFYCKRQKLSSYCDKITQKIIRNIEYFSNTDFDCEYFYTGNIDLDLLFISKKSFSDPLKEAKYLHNLYRFYVQAKNTKTDIAQKLLIRIMNDLKIIDSNGLLYFLRYVFTAETLLFSSLSNLNVLKLFLDFTKGFLLRSVSLNEKILSLYKTLILKLHADKDLVLFLFSDLPSNEIYKNINTDLILLHIWKSKSLSQLKKFYQNNTESFISTKNFLEEFHKLLIVILTTRIEYLQTEMILDFIFEIWNMTKQEFKPKTYKYFFNIIFMVFSHVDIFLLRKHENYVIDAEKSRALEFFKKVAEISFSKLSSFLLFLQNQESSHKNDSKKKKKTITHNSKKNTTSNIYKINKIVLSIEKTGKNFFGSELTHGISFLKFQSCIITPKTE